jgi:WD40 repeat protein
VTGIVVGSDKGSISIFSYPFTKQVLDSVTAHSSEVSRMIISPDNQYLFTAGVDGTLFTFKITEQTLQSDGSTKSSLLEEDKYEEVTNSIVDEALADIVLVKKNEMEEWQKKQEELKQELAINKRKVE